MPHHLQTTHLQQGTCQAVCGSSTQGVWQQQAGRRQQLDQSCPVIVYDSPVLPPFAKGGGKPWTAQPLCFKAVWQSM
jgi:hypothetical protein